MDVHGLLYSQIGYDLGDPMRAIIRGGSRDHIPDGTTFEVHQADGSLAADARASEDGIAPGAASSTGEVRYWGAVWHGHWWEIDFSAIAEPGSYVISVTAPDTSGIYTSEPIRVARSLLWQETVVPVAVEQMEGRQRLARNGIGWRDCGAEWREANSHATMIIALCRLVDAGWSWLEPETADRIYDQIVHGCTYLGILQDAGEQTGAPEGAIIHEIPSHMDIIPGDSAQGAVALAYAARLLADSRPEVARELSARALAAMDYLLLEAQPHGPSGFSPMNHGAPEDFRVPDEFMTRDLAMMMWGCVELYVGGHVEYKRHAVRLAREEIGRAHV